MFEKCTMSLKIFAGYRVLPGGHRVQPIGSGSDPGIQWSGRFGAGYKKREPVRVRVRKLVPVQDSNLDLIDQLNLRGKLTVDFGLNIYTRDSSFV